jgi:phosphoribosylanthranilate isomerase
MTWVKICGITNLEDALTAVEAGADAVGFVFYEKSPRVVRAEVSRAIVEQVPGHVEKVGVFVDQSVGQAEQMAAQIGLTGIQLHYIGTERLPPLPVSRFQRYLALRASRFLKDGGVPDLNLAGESPVSAVFLDSGTPEQPGGTGNQFNWAKAAPLVQKLEQCFKVVVAGGLRPANVGEAIRTLKPWGVDVSSGVEAHPGKKDPAKVHAFVEAVRRASGN